MMVGDVNLDVHALNVLVFKEFAARIQWKDSDADLAHRAMKEMVRDV